MALALNELEYLERVGLNVMLAHDYYPESHQGGVGIIQNGLRVATNGDIRLEPTPGQWSPVPVVGPRQIDRARHEISVRMDYPDESKNRRGFNPIEYPDLRFAYTVRVYPSGNGFRIVVELEAPLPEEWRDRVGFNLELFPGYLFGKTYRMGDAFGIFPQQANGRESGALATGRTLTVAPESERQRLTIEAVTGGELQLIDGRSLHNNGWFVVRALMQGERLEWQVNPNTVTDWRSEPVVQVSQVGYHPNQPKAAVIELDRNDETRHPVVLERIGETGAKTVLSGNAAEWGRFLRYHYLRFDFTAVREPGMYIVRYGGYASSPFAIDDKVFERGIWQPAVDTFLPVQMCHMRINENYRVWHGACHLDDALMAPTDHNHFDGYIQGPSALTEYKSGERVPGLDRGGWHDAGDYDLRIESQCDTIHGLALAYEQFGIDYDNTTVDQENRIVELMRPDGKPDILQQIEHGLLSVLGGYRSLGRLYRGIIEPTLRQYVHLGDAATQTDNLPSDDDRWVFTEENPARELNAAAALAAAARALRGFNDAMAAECVQVAEEIFERTAFDRQSQFFGLALELLQTTSHPRYRDVLLGMVDLVRDRPESLGWLAARSLALVDDSGYRSQVKESLEAYRRQVEELERKTPYGLPYEPDIWGAGWGIQRFGVEQYWLHASCPEIFPIDYMLHAINFVLGCHPGPNTASFVSGVGSKSLLPGYGVNRADWGYIPGGSGSGTALIRPDFPELLEWPYLWQQTEYCLGYPTSDYVFLIAAADHLLRVVG